LQKGLPRRSGGQEGKRVAPGARIFSATVVEAIKFKAAQKVFLPAIFKDKIWAVH